LDQDFRRAIFFYAGSFATGKLANQLYRRFVQMVGVCNPFLLEDVGAILQFTESPPQEV
jgi:hypothetical protein